MKKLLSLFVIFLTAVAAPAQTNFWWTNTVSTVTNAWSGGGNWLDGGAPVSQSDTAINFFQPAPAYVTTNDLTLTINQLNFSNSAVTIIGNALTFTNDTTLDLPQINQFGASNVVIRTALVLTTNITFAGAGTGTITASGVISGAGGLTMSGAGYRLILTGNNTYTGGTLINGGMLAITTNSNVGTGAINVGANGILFVDTTAANQIFSNSIQGTGLITNTGAAAKNFVLVGSNSFSGTYTPSGAGSLVFDSLTSADGRPHLNITPNGSVAIGSSIAGTNITFSSLSGAGSVTVNYGATTTARTLYLLQNTNTVFAGSLGDASGGRVLALTKDGTGVLTLTGTGTMSGNTTILGGQIVMASANVFQNSTVSNLVPNGIAFSNVAATTIGGLAGTGDIALTNLATGAGVALTVGHNNSDFVFIFRVDPETGKLTPTGQKVEVSMAVCVKFMPLE